MFILHLSADQSGEWIELNEFGDAIALQPIASLSDCPKINVNDVLVIAMPGEQITVTSIALPKTRPAERLRVAPFALEEQIACDPDAIYVTLGDQHGEKFPVAIIDQNVFEAQYAAWIEAGLHPRIATPDFLALAWEPETWTIVLHREMALVRTGLQSGFSTDHNNLVFFLKQLLQQGLGESPSALFAKPKKIIVWQENNILSLHELEQYRIPVETRDATYKNKWDAKGLLSQLNLLQGKYRPKIESSLLQKRWRACGITACALFVFLFVSQFVEWIYLRQEAHTLQGQVTSLYRELFPGATSVLEPHFRTDALLKRFERAEQGGTFLRLTRATGSTLLHYPDIHLMSLQFQYKTMQLTVTAQNAGLLTQWNNALRAKGVTIKQTITKTDPTFVQAMVVIS